MVQVKSTYSREANFDPLRPVLESTEIRTPIAPTAAQAALITFRPLGAQCGAAASRWRSWRWISFHPASRAQARCRALFAPIKTHSNQSVCRNQGPTTTTRRKRRMPGLKGVVSVTVTGEVVAAEGAVSAVQVTRFVETCTL